MTPRPLRSFALAATFALASAASAAAQGGCPNDDIYENFDVCDASIPFVSMDPALLDELVVFDTDPDWIDARLMPGESIEVTIRFSHANADLDLVLNELVATSCGPMLALSQSVTDDETVVHTNNTGQVQDVVWGIYWYSGATCADYDLEVTIGSDPCAIDDPYEDNDTCFQAWTLPLGRFDDLLCADLDEDYWELDVAPGDGLLVVIDFEHADGDLDLYLYDGSDCLSPLDSSASVTDQEVVEWRNNTGASVRVVAHVVYFPNDGGCNTYALTCGDALGGTLHYTLGCGRNNSTGGPAVFDVVGTPFVANNDIRFAVGNLPLNSVGYFLNSTGYGEVSPPGSQGVICLSGGPIGRFIRPGEVLVAAGPPSVDLQIDLTDIPRPNGIASIQPGEVWFFQYWYRDSVNGAATSNMSNAVALVLQ